MLRRRTALGLAGLAVPALPGPAFAQSFPERPVRYVVPFAPGGLTDTMARLLGARLGEIWGRPVVVENRAGGNAMIGADVVAKSPPDGHTLLAMTLTHTVNASLFPNAPYDFARDLRVISVLGALPLVAVVRAEAPWRTLADLAAAARARALNGGSSGTGSPPHLGLELFRISAQAGQNIVHAPYRGGALSLTDLIAGSLDLIVSNLPECLPHIQGGRLRGLAVTAETRHPLIPDIPTVIEAGFPSLVITNWTGVAIPRATPEPVVAQLWAAIERAMADPDLRRRAEGGGFTLVVSPPVEADRFALAEMARWAKLVADAGIKAD
jgi:tripartite-type tricarboxylate transporter receptor subunit TctC